MCTAGLLQWQCSGQGVGQRVCQLTRRRRRGQWLQQQPHLVQALCRTTVPTTIQTTTITTTTTTTTTTTITTTITTTANRSLYSTATVTVTLSSDSSRPWHS